MNSKDLIKYGIIAVGVYLIYRYVQTQGGLERLLGMTPGTAPGVTPPPPAPGTSTGTTPPPPTPPVLDTSGLSVVPDVNDSLTGYVKINGQPIKLSIIQTDGRIFDVNGQEVTGALQSQGVDIVALRSAFASAGGLGAIVMARPRTPYWLM